MGTKSSPSLIECWLGVNKLFFQNNDVYFLATVVAFMFFKGKMISMLSEASVLRLDSFNAHTRSEFLHGLSQYATCVLLVSPLNLVFNTFLRRLQALWSNRLTLHLARTMVSLFVSKTTSLEKFNAHDTALSIRWNL